MKLVITGVQNFKDDIRHKITALGYKILDHADENTEFSEEEYGCDVLVAFSPFRVSKLEKFNNLKFFQSISAGYDTLPIDEIKELGIKFANARGVYSVPIAELTVMRILEIYKKSAMYMKQQENHEWKRDFRLREITDKKAAILGTGSIGVQIAKRLKAFDAVTIGFNKSEKPAEYFDCVHSIDKFAEMVGEFDIIIVALPLNGGTVHIINKDILNRMHDKSILINIGRGQSVDTTSLCKVLNEGKILGAALDVFEEEPLSKASPLWDAKGLLITPHISSGSNYMNKRIYELVYDNLKAFAEGKEVKNRIV